MKKPALLLLTVGLMMLASSQYMTIKAQFAQWLIAQSWQTRELSSRANKPWPWADTRPIALLEIARLDKAMYVMEDASGESLAFGPGHVQQSAQISSDGHVVISGHRDSHFEFLQQLKNDDVISTENSMGIKVRYKVTASRVINSDNEPLLRLDQSHLTLLTCYPFESIVPGGPLRYLVEAEPLPEPQSKSI